MSKKKKILNKIVSSKCMLEIEIYRRVKIAAAMTDINIRVWIRNAVLEKLNKG